MAIVQTGWHLCARAMTGLLLAMGMLTTALAQSMTLKDICGTCQFEKYASCGEFLEGINFDQQGHGWAVGLFTGAIIEVVDGKCTVRAKTGGRPNGARFHADGRLFVTDQQLGILIYDPVSNAVSVFADRIGNEPMVNANDLVFDKDGGLYATIPGTSQYLNRSGRVIYFAPGSNSATVLAENLPYPNGISLHPDGKFINIGLYADKTIITLPSMQNPGSARSPYAAVRTDGGIGPDGLAMDRDGRYYWANFLAGAVGVTDERGFVIGYMRLPDQAGRMTTNLAFYKGHLYVTEASRGEIWRIKVTPVGQTLYLQPK
jgi:gluconolactonase